MREKIKAVLDTVTTSDVRSGPSLDSPRVLSEAVRRRLMEIVNLELEALPELLIYARWLQHRMVVLCLEEADRKLSPPTPKQGFLARFLAKKPPAPVHPPEPEMTSERRRAQLKGAIYAIGLIAGDPDCRTPDTMRLLREFSQEGQRDVSEDARDILRQYGIGDRELWEDVLMHLRLVRVEPDETQLTLAEVLTALENTSSLHLVERRADGSRFIFGSSWTHTHAFYKVAGSKFVRRVTRI